MFLSRVKHSGVTCIADGAELLANGAAADKPATSTRSHKSSDSAAKADSAAEPVSADSIMTTAEPASADHEPTPVDMSGAGQMSAATVKGDEPQAGRTTPATNGDNGPVGVVQEEEVEPLAATAAADDKVGKSEAALSAAFAEAEVAGEAKEAAFAEARKAGQSAVAASAEAEIAKEEAGEAALEEAKQAQEDKEEGKPAPAKDADVRDHQQDQVWILQCTRVSASAVPPPPHPLAPPHLSQHMRISWSHCPACTSLLLHTPCLCIRDSQLTPCLCPATPCPLHARLFCYAVPTDVRLLLAPGCQACCSR